VSGCDHLDDAALVAAFEACAIDARDYRHREHLRLAFAMLRDADFGDGAARLRRALRAFASAIGAEAKYHETLTWAYLAIVAERMADHRTSFELLAAHPDLLDHRATIGRYSDLDATLASPLARRVFVLPTRS
jgi:hypothetical protein